MALANTASDCYLVWERLPVTVTTEYRFVSISLTGIQWWATTHTTGACKFLFLTQAAAEALVAMLMDKSRTQGIVCRNDTFSRFPCYVNAITMGPGETAISAVSKWTAEAVRRSDGVGFDVEVNIDYTEASLVVQGGGS